MAVKQIAKYKYGKIEVEVLKIDGIFHVRRLRRSKITEKKMVFLKEHKEKVDYDLLCTTQKKKECDMFIHGLSFGYHLNNEKNG